MTATSAGRPDTNANLSQDATLWQPVAAGRARLELSTAVRSAGAALRLSFDFADAGGFVVARRPAPQSLPPRWAIGFGLRGLPAGNDLELKLVDANDSVWRRTWQQPDLTTRWRGFVLDADDFAFAWGPAGGGRPADLSAIEFAVVAGDRECAAQGWLEIRDLQVIELRDAPASVSASSRQADLAAETLDSVGWCPQPDDPRPWLQIDFGRRRRVGGLIIEWAAASGPAHGLRLRSGGLGRRWTTRANLPRIRGARSYLPLPDLQCNRLRLELGDATAGARIRIADAEFGDSQAGFWHAVAADQPRGRQPRWLLREQCLWTPVGTADSGAQALLDEDGRFEWAPASGLIEPMLWIDGELLNWADVAISQHLEGDWMPQPGVRWQGADWSLSITAGSDDEGRLRLGYRIDNSRDQALQARLLLLIRPLQVTPPWQSHGRFGGAAPIHEILTAGDGLRIDGRTRLRIPERKTYCAAVAFSDTDMAALLAAGEWPDDVAVSDPGGRAQGLLSATLQAPAGGHDSCTLTVDADDSPPAGNATADPAPEDYDWWQQLPVATLQAAGDAHDILHSLWTASAHILMTRDGPALQPGPRRYRRSWIRDGAGMSAALLRVGRAADVAAFIDWYAPRIRNDGYVPCCVDASGADPLVEHDSHGQWLHLIADYLDFVDDPARRASLWPGIERTVDYIARVRDPSGLLPASVSHEGYLSQPVHAYWDDGWAIAGVRAAARLARRHGRDALAGRCEQLHQSLAVALWKSMRDTRSAGNLDTLPASVEWADFDPTATAMLLGQTDPPTAADRTALEQTFARYLADWRRRRSGALDWRNYTPYEIRIVGAMARLGWRESALELLRFFVADARPRAWRQWPEIAWRDRRAPGHLGDLPHTWIAAEYVLAARSLFVYERYEPDTLVIAAGTDPAWLDGDGLRFDALPTAFGALSGSLRRAASDLLHVRIAPGIGARMELRPPLAGAIADIGHASGVDVHWTPDCVHLPPLTAPIELRIRTA